MRGLGRSLAAAFCLILRREPLDPLVRLPPAHGGKLLADAALEALYASLTPPLNSEGLEQIHLALAGLRLAGAGGEIT